MAARKKPSGKTQEERDRISLGRIESYMDGLIEQQLHCPSCRERFDVKEITAGAVGLIKARYDKLRPSLSAVEQSYAKPEDGLTAEELEALKALAVRQWVQDHPQEAAKLLNAAPRTPQIEEPVQIVAH